MKTVSFFGQRDPLLSLKIKDLAYRSGCSAGNKIDIQHVKHLDLVNVYIENNNITPLEKFKLSKLLKKLGESEPLRPLKIDLKRIPLLQEDGICDQEINKADDTDESDVVNDTVETDEAGIDVFVGKKF